MTSSSNHLKNLGARSVNVIGSSERLARTILFFNIWRFTALSIAAGKIPHPSREVNENMVRTDSQGIWSGFLTRLLENGFYVARLTIVGPSIVGPSIVGPSIVWLHAVGLSLFESIIYD